MKEYNVIGSIWYDKIGIVRVQTEYSGIRYYIGIGQGVDQESDEQHIAAWGRPFYPSIIIPFMAEE